MAKALLLLLLLPLISHLLLDTAVSTSGSDAPPDIHLPGTNPSGPENEKLTRKPLRFYWHDNLAGADPSVVEVAHSSIQNPTTHFGTIKIMDDPLTIGPNRSSQVIGKCQGMYLYADKTTIGIFMAMTLTFTAGEYAGSSLTMVGRNEALLEEREMPITGGTGRLRYANGYARVRTISFEPTEFYFVVEYTCYFTTSPYHISSAAIADSE